MDGLAAPDAFCIFTSKVDACFSSLIISVMYVSRLISRVMAAARHLTLMRSLHLIMARAIDLLPPYIARHFSRTNLLRSFRLELMRHRAAAWIQAQSQ